MGEDGNLKNAFDELRAQLYSANGAGVQVKDAYIIGAIANELARILERRTAERDARNPLTESDENLTREAIEIAYLNNAMCYATLSLTRDKDSIKTLEDYIKMNNNLINSLSEYK